MVSLQVSTTANNSDNPLKKDALLPNSSEVLLELGAAFSQVTSYVSGKFVLGCIRFISLSSQAKIMYSQFELEKICFISLPCQANISYAKLQFVYFSLVGRPGHFNFSSILWAILSIFVFTLINIVYSRQLFSLWMLNSLEGPIAKCWSCVCMALYSPSLSHSGFKEEIFLIIYVAL